MRHRLRIAALLAASALFAGCGGSGTAVPGFQGIPVTVAAGSLPRPDHVVIVIFENKDYDQVIGARRAPYLNSLANGGMNFTDSHAETHPSQPNYIALISGSMHGVEDNECPHDLGDQPNLFRQLLDAGFTAASYSEGMPSAGYKGCESGDYARKHNPVPNFSNIPESSNLPFSDFPSDYSKLPTVSLVVPDLCNDMHDCNVSAGDDWAQQNMAGYAEWAKTHNSLLIVTFDEDNGSNDNLIPTIFYGQMAPAGEFNQRIDHYNVLRTIQEMYGLPPLGESASSQTISGLVHN